MLVKAIYTGIKNDYFTPGVKYSITVVSNSIMYNGNAVINYNTVEEFLSNWKIK